MAAQAVVLLLMRGGATMVAGEAPGSTGDRRSSGIQRRRRRALLRAPLIRMLLTPGPRPPRGAQRLSRRCPQACRGAVPRSEEHVGLPCSGAEVEEQELLHGKSRGLVDLCG
jgi:hypothetical protein